MGKRKAPRQGGAPSEKGNGQASLSRDDEPGPGQPTLTAYEQARNDNVASNQQLLANLRMPQIRGEESAQPRAARTPRCEPLRRGRLHPVVTQLCRRIQNGDLAPTRQSSRHRASALTPRDSAALNDDSGEPEVFLVPVGYWLRDTPHGATIHCSVENGPKAVGIFARHSGGDMELDFGPATKLFPSDTAQQWLVRDSTEAAAMRLAWAQHRGTQPEPNQGNSDRRETPRSPDPPQRAAPRGHAGARPRRNARRVQASARGDEGSLVREPLPLKLPLPVVPPAIIDGEPAAWVDTHKSLLREWVTEALEGTGLARHVPTDDNPLPACAVRDSFLAPTEGLLQELSAALRRYVMVLAHARRLRHEVAAA